MGTQVCSFRHRRVLNLHANQAQTKGDDPSGVINGFKILTVCLTISNDTASSFCGDSEANQVEDEVGNTHVHGVSVEHKLTVVRPGS